MHPYNMHINNSTNPYAYFTDQAGFPCWIPEHPIYREKNFYFIQPGDNLYYIAHFFNVSLQDLITENPGIHPYFLIPGQMISIPLPLPSEDCPQIYAVRPGDTFYHIAVNNDLSVKDLMNANPDINPNALLIGQKICLPKNKSRFRRLWRILAGMEN
ncbi:LysM domain-containing protein [Thalassobacillus cyri]|uniref:LysM domain-containing protein n=2 Tax=Thalassobacillus cyri TaxID=571932 RepID=A0A1H4EJF4_9BACI|nr:LysM domain-containing protein [Thalassobacillus cyri]